MTLPAFTGGAARLLCAGILWQPALPPLALAAAVLLTVLAGWIAWRALRQRWDARTARPLAAVRAVALGLVLLALLDPACRRQAARETARRVLVLLDRSASMDVADDGHSARAARADACLARLRRALPRDAEVTVWPFDREVHPPGRPVTATRDGTDIAGALLAAEEAGGWSAIALLTDGGDEPLRPARLPRAPVAIVGFGTDPASWCDVAMLAPAAPAAVEKDAVFEIETDLAVRGASNRSFRAGLAAVAVNLEHRGEDGRWTRADGRSVALAGGRGRAVFRTASGEPGSHVYRVSAEPVPGELSDLNNRRAVRVDVRREALDVLYFSRRLGADLKMLRQELSTDPALAFSAVYRIGGERYTVQAADGVPAGTLADGLPADAETLRRFDCVIVGSFPFADWRPEEAEALRAYVDQGGGVVWLGGEESFEGGGYAATSLAHLFPWRLAGGASTLLRGSYPVSVPALAAVHPAVAGLREMLAAAPLSLASLNRVQDLGPAAQTLMEAETPEGRSPVLVEQRAGRGRSLTLASNTSWQWARTPGPPAAFYRRLWRQLVRAAAGQAEGGRLMQVTWDRTDFRPAEEAGVTIRLTDPAGVRLKATLSGADGQVALPLQPAAAADTWRAEILCRRRGLYQFRVEAERGGEKIEAFEKTLEVQPLAEEGASLERRDADLARLAAQCRGIYRPEERAEEAADALRAWISAARREEPVSVVSDGPAFLALFLAVLVAEWTLRRRRNLV